MLISSDKYSLSEGGFAPVGIFPPAPRLLCVFVRIELHGSRCYSYSFFGMGGMPEIYNALFTRFHRIAIKK